MTKDLISIIVPVYNVEMYLENCINSIVSSTYKEIEIIIVENGSTDNSWMICQNLKKKHQNIKLIQTEVKGLSHARNLGLSYATGEYIAYVDSDDYVSPYMYERLISVAKEYNADMVVCDFISGIDLNYHFEMDNRKSYKKIVYDEYSYYSYIKNLPLYNVVWNKLYKKIFISNVLFNENLKYCEDRTYISECIKSSSNIIYIDSKLYYYNLGNNSSICRSSSNIIERMDQIYSLVYDKNNHDKNSIVYEYINLCLLKTCDFRLKRSKVLKLDNVEEIQLILKDTLKDVYKIKKASKMIKYRFLIEHYFPFVENVEGILIKLRDKLL